MMMQYLLIVNHYGPTLNLHSRTWWRMRALTPPDFLIANEAVTPSNSIPRNLVRLEGVEPTALPMSKEASTVGIKAQNQTVPTSPHTQRRW